MNAHRALSCAAVLLSLSVPPALAADPQPAPTESAWIEAGAGADYLSNGLGDWSTAYISFETSSGPRTSWHASTDSDSRFGKTDSQYLVGTYFPPSTNTILNVELALSPTHQILPSSEIGLSLDHRLAAGWGYALGLQDRSYNGANVSIDSVSVDRYWRTFRAAYTTFATRVSNVPGVSFSEALLLTHYYGASDASSLTAALNAGREAENDGGPVLVSAVIGVSLTGAHWFGANSSAIIWSVSVTRQGSLYTRSGGQVGFRRRL